MSVERIFREWWSLLAAFFAITLFVIVVAVATNPFNAQEFFVLLVSTPILYLAGFFPYWMIPFAEPLTWIGLLLFLSYSVAVMSFIGHSENMPSWLLYPSYITLLLLYTISHYFFFVS